MTPDIEISKAAREDLPQLVALLEQDLASLKISHPREEIDATLRSIIDDTTQRTVLWVARHTESKRVHGLVFANLIYSVKHAGRALWIEQLYVDPHGRRGGIGRALVSQILDWAEGQGIRGVDLESYQLNAPASILYRSEGFRRLGRERFSISLASTEAEE